MIFERVKIVSWFTQESLSENSGAQNVSKKTSTMKSTLVLYLIYITLLLQLFSWYLIQA